MLKHEEAEASSFYTDELAKAQAEAMDRFYAKPYGDEAPRRSSVVTHDIEDTINWLMPDLMRVFMSSDELVTIEPGSKEDEQPYEGDPDGRPMTECVADYLDHVFFKDNAGETNIYDFAFDGLLQRQGVIRSAWQDPSPKPQKTLEGIAPENLAKYVEDSEYEITGYEHRETDLGPVFDLQVIHTPKMGRVVVEAIPPEEFAISKRAKSIANADYHRWKHEVFVADLMREFPKKKADLDPEGSYRATTSDDETDTDPRVAARFNGQMVTTDTEGNYTQNRKKVWLIEEFIKVDYDGDGVVELRAVKRVGDIILENEAVERSGFRVWTPMRISHKIAGRSLADVLIDLQKIRTVVTRRALDGLAQALTPKVAINMQAMGKDAEGIDDLLDNEIGGHVRVNGDPSAAVMPLITPDVSGSAYQMLEYMDQRSAEASGVTKHSQGLDPNALNKTATGIDLLQAAAKTRIEMIARWLGVALEDVFQDILHLICAHQDGVRQVKISNKWMKIDPRTWSDEMRVKIHVGMSAASRAQQIANLHMIANKQEQILAAQPSNPIVQVQHLRNTYARMAEAMGYKDPSRFFAEIPKDYKMPPQKDAKTVEAEGKLQIAAQDAQSKQQLALVDLRTKTQLAQAEAQQQAHLQEQEAAHKMQLAQFKAQQEARLSQQRIQAETELAILEFTERAKLERWKTGEQLKIQKETASAKVSAGGSERTGSSVRFGGDVG